MTEEPEDLPGLPPGEDDSDLPDEPGLFWKLWGGCKLAAIAAGLMGLVFILEKTGIIGRVGVPGA